jgi:heat shock protein HtpX
VQELFLDHPRAAGIAGLFASHPPIEARIGALVRFAGGRAAADLPPVAPVTPETRDLGGPPQAATPPIGPWTPRS